MNITEGMILKRLAIEEMEDDEGECESLTLTPVDIRSMRSDNQRSAMCNLFITMGNSLTLSHNMKVDVAPSNTMSNITMKMCGCHITSEKPVTNPMSIRRTRRV